MLDLDHFKRINDRHGHAVGDQVLIELTALVGASTRRVDRFFRYGGEEFVLLVNLQGGAQSLDCVADKLVLKVAAELRCRGEPITVSIGGAALRPGDDVRVWLGRADAALYRAKDLGRSRAVIAADGDEGG
jgi:diguanylate cyclase (GGDEF)-like protein